MCSQRSLEAETVDWVELAGAAVDCAKAARGERTSAEAAMKAVFAKKGLLRSDINGFLLTGAEPVLEDRYESGGRKVSGNEIDS